MGSVRSIAPKGIRAAAGDGIPTYWLGGIVGLDFTGAELSAEVERACKQYGECKLIIDSVGGLASDAFTFYDYVRVKGLKVWAEGYGTVASAATVLMAAAGRQRSSLAPNAEYLVHEASGGDEEGAERYNARLADVYAELSGKTAKEWREIMAEDKPKDAQWAKKMKLVGEVLQHERIAAQLIPMEEEVKPEVETPEVVPPVVEATEEVEQEIPVTVPQAIEAAVKGKIIAKVKVSAELRTAMTNAIQEAKDTKEQLQERVDEVTALNEKLTKAQVEVAAANEAKAKAEGELATMNTKLGELATEVEKLKKAPLASAEGEPKGGVTTPGAGPSTTTPQAGSRDAKAERVAAVVEATINKYTKRSTNAAPKA